MDITSKALLDASIARIDAMAVNWSEEMREDWKRVRGAARRHQRDSHRIVPSMAVAAQEVAASRDHAQRALDAMSGVFSSASDDEKVGE